MACHRSSCTNYHPQADDLCDPCDEFSKQKRREEYGVVCMHCNQMFTTHGGFDRHAWNIYHREHYRPIPRRVRL